MRQPNILLLILLATIFLTSCTKEAEIKQRKYPMVQTNIQLTDESVILIGDLIEGEQPILCYGFVYDTNHYLSHLSTSDTIYLKGNPEDSFSVDLHAGFKPNKTYIVSAFIKTKEVTFVGNQLSFQFNNSKALELASFNPRRGTTDDLISIKGRYFSSSKRGNLVTFGSDTAIVEHASENELLVRVPNIPDEQQCRIKVTTPTSNATFTDYFERWYKWRRLLDSIPGHNHYGEKCGDYFYMFDFTVKDMFRFNVITGESNLCSPIPSNYIDYLDASFCCNGMLYFLFNGRTDLWEYNPDIDLWSLKKPFPRASGYFLDPFVVHQKVYLPLRVNNDLTQIYEYDPLNDEWNRKSDFPGEFYTNGPLTSNGFSFSSANMGYMGTPRKIYQYDPLNDKWTYLTEYPGEGILNVSGFYINNQIYIGLGQLDWEYQVMRDVWSFNPSTLQWDRSASFPVPEKEEIYISLISSSDGYAIKHYNSKKMQLLHFNPERE